MLLVDMIYIFYDLTKVRALAIMAFKYSRVECIQKKHDKYLYVQCSVRLGITITHYLLSQQCAPNLFFNPKNIYITPKQ